MLERSTRSCCCQSDVHPANADNVHPLHSKPSRLLLFAKLFLQYPNQCEAPICTARFFFFRTTLDRNSKYRVPIIHHPAFQLLYLLFEHSSTGHSAFLTVLIASFPSPVLYCPCSWHRSDIHTVHRKNPRTAFDWTLLPSPPLASCWSVHIVPFPTPDLSRQGWTPSSCPYCLARDAR